jgi:hypothetical protein
MRDKLGRFTIGNAGHTTKHSDATKLKISLAKKGTPAWNKGKPNTWSKPPILYKENNSAWKADHVGYVSLHKWIRRQLGIPISCSKDKTHIAPLYFWCNISGEYKRDLNDWHSLCPSCNKTDGVSRKTQFDENGHRRALAN